NSDDFLMKQIEMAKFAFSNDEREENVIIFKEKNKKVNLTRSKFDELCEKFYSKIDKLVKEAMKGVVGFDLKPYGFDELVLGGGLARLHKVQELVKDKLEKQ